MWTFCGVTLNWNLKQYTFSTICDSTAVLIVRGGTGVWELVHKGLMPLPCWGVRVDTELVKPSVCFCSLAWGRASSLYKLSTRTPCWENQGCNWLTQVYLNMAIVCMCECIGRLTEWWWIKLVETCSWKIVILLLLTCYQ